MEKSFDGVVNIAKVFVRGMSGGKIRYICALQFSVCVKMFVE